MKQVYMYIIKNVKFLILSVAHSTWVCNDTIHPSTSSLDIWNFPLSNGGMFKHAPINNRSSSMSNPLSDITESSSSNKSSTPLFLIKALSDMLPGREEKQMEMLTRALNMYIWKTHLLKLWLVQLLNEGFGCIKNDSSIWVSCLKLLWHVCFH